MLYRTHDTPFSTNVT